MSAESTRTQQIGWFRLMLLIRRFEEEAANLYRQGHIGGFCHLCIGQEAVAVGCYSVLQPQDTAITAYRAHGHILACGTDPKSVMAELTGRQAGCSQGRGGSMHMFDPRRGFYGGHGIVGAQIPLGTGMALAHKYLKDRGLCVAFMGDGAANQGQVYEAMNMASLWKLPIIYVIENNGYAMGTSVERGCAGPGLYTRGEGFGVSGRSVDGMTVQDVYQAFQEACDHVRAGGAPLLLEMDTYRYRGHSMSDPGKYRTRDDVESMRKQRDPVQACLKRLQDTFDDTEPEVTRITQDVENIIQEAVAFALSALEPLLSSLHDHVWAEGTWSPYTRAAV